MKEFQVIRVPETVSDEVQPKVGISTAAEHLQGRLHDRLGSLSPSRRAELFAANAERAEANGLHLRTHTDEGLGTVPIPLVSVPTFLDRESMKRHAKDMQTVYNVLLRIEELALSDTELGREIFGTITKGMTPEQAELVDRARVRSRATARNRNSRADTFINGGKAQAIEYNNVNPESLRLHHGLTHTGIGFLSEVGLPLELTSSQWANITKQANNTAAHQGLAMLTNEVKRRTGKNPKSIGVVFDQAAPNDPQHDPTILNRSEMPELRRVFDRLSHGQIKTVIGDPTDVTVSGKDMAINGEKVDIVWRNEIDMARAMHDPAAADFIKIVSNPKDFIVLNDETSSIIGSKATLALLFDERIRKAIGMKPKEVAAIERSIPFSFIPADNVYLEVAGKEISAEEFLKRERESHLIKRSSATHGSDIYFGTNDEIPWDAIVDHAVETEVFTAQQVIPYDAIQAPLLVLDADGTLRTDSFVSDVNFYKIGPNTPSASISRAFPHHQGDKAKTLNVAGSGGGGIKPTFW